MSKATSTLIYIGNFDDLDPNESNYSNENASEIFRTFDNEDMSVVTVVQRDANDDGQVQENDNGQTPDTFSYDLGQGHVTSGLDNAARYSVDFVDENGDTHSTHVSAYQTENGDVFLRFPNGLKVQRVTINERVGDGYASIHHGASSNTEVVCFAPGTFINCPDGPVAVETLNVGDLVETLHNGPQPVRWIHSGDHPLDGERRDAMPVLVRSGSLGAGLPGKDLIVSPQHRIFVGGRNQLEDVFPTEALAPAKALTGLKGVRHMMGKKDITWMHIAFDRHEVIVANGCLAESILLGPMVLAGLTPMKRQMLNDMYGTTPDSRKALNGPTPYRCLSVGEARRQIAAAPPIQQPKCAA